MLQQSPAKTYLYKSCSRCYGDLVLDSEVEQRLMIDERIEYVCLQCGRRASMEATSSVRTPAAATRAA